MQVDLVLERVLVAQYCGRDAVIELLARLTVESNNDTFLASRKVDLLPQASIHEIRTVLEAIGYDVEVDSLMPPLSSRLCSKLDSLSSKHPAILLIGSDSSTGSVGHYVLLEHASYNRAIIFDPQQQKRVLVGDVSQLSTAHSHVIFVNSPGYPILVFWSLLLLGLFFTAYLYLRRFQRAAGAVV